MNTTPKFDNNTLHKNFMDLLNIYAPSGKETPVREYLKSYFDGKVDNMMVDSYGNLLITKKFGTGRSTVMLSAHMDTVPHTEMYRTIHREHNTYFALTNDGSKAILGADDRAGIAIIMNAFDNLIENPHIFDGTLKIAFTREEEIGCIGSSKMKKRFYTNVDLAIVVDRRGTKEIVVGCLQPFCSTSVGEYLESVNDSWTCVEGGISDALTFSEQGINSVNISAGYSNEHTVNETADFEMMKDSVLFIENVFKTINEHIHTFKSVPQVNKWVKDEMFFSDETETVVEYEDGYGHTTVEQLNDGSFYIIQNGSSIRLSDEILYQIANDFLLSKGEKSL